MNSRLWTLKHRVMNSNIRENVLLVHSVIICAFSFPTATLVNVLLKLISVFFFLEFNHFNFNMVILMKVSLPSLGSLPIGNIDS